MKDKIFRSDLAVLIFFVVISLVNFGGNLRAEFMIDDHGLIVNHEFVSGHSIKNFFEHFIPDYKSRKGIENASQAVYYRPIAHIIPFLQSLVFKDDPFGYHLTNLLLFALACLSVYILLREISGNSNTAFIAATLFCLHPINGFMVNYITASVYSAQLIFLILAVFFYLRKEDLRYGFLLSLAMFIFALLCHETSLVLPLYIFLICRHQKLGMNAALKSALPFGGIALGYFILRLRVASLGDSLLTKIIFFDDLNVVTYTATFFRLVAWYVERLIMMNDMLIIWSTPLIKNGSLWLLFAVVIIGGLFFLLRHWRGTKRAVYVLWFLIGLLPVSVGSLFIPKTGMMIEPHWLFFASIGLFALGADFLARGLDKTILKYRYFILTIIFLMMLVLSAANNRNWSDELSFARHWARLVPTNKNALFCYANALFKKGHFEEAKQFFGLALMDDHNDWQNYNNLAQIALAEGDEQVALDYYGAALSVFPQSAVVHNNLGVFFMKRNDLEQAKLYFEKTRELNPHQPEALLNLGLIHESLGDYVSAKEFYLQARELRPSDERAIAALLRTDLLVSGVPFDKARFTNDLGRIKDMDLLNGIGGHLAVNGHAGIAIMYYSRVIVLYPQHPFAYQEAGKIFANAGHYDQARKIWQEGAARTGRVEEFRFLFDELERVNSTRTR